MVGGFLAIISLLLMRTPAMAVYSCSGRPPGKNVGQTVGVVGEALGVPQLVQLVVFLGVPLQTHKCNTGS